MVNVKDVLYGRTLRKSYNKIDELTEMPNLIQVQKDSFKWFCNEGLREVFDDMAPITDYSGKLELKFVDYVLEYKPKYTVAMCKERDATYAIPMKVRVRLLNKDDDGHGYVHDQRRRTCHYFSDRPFAGHVLRCQA